MKNWSIDNKLWLCVLSPCALCCCLLVLVFASRYNQQLEQSFTSRNLLVSQYLNQASTKALSDTGELKNIFSQQLIEQRDLLTILLLREDGSVILQQGQNLFGNRNSTDKIDSIPGKVLADDPTTSYSTVGSESFFSTKISDNGNQSLTLILGFDRAPLQVQKFQLVLVLVLVAGFILLLSVFMFAILKRQLVRPFTQLRSNLEQLSYGDLDNIDTNQYGQPFDLLFSYIKRTGDLILASRKELQETVEQATGDLRETLETVEEQNIELNLARKQALAANKAKTEFLSNTSHEIRTPINGILGFVQLLYKSNLDEQQVDFLRNIEKSSQGLLTTINNILDVAKIETSQLVLDYNPFNLQEVVDDCVGIFTNTARGKNLQLKVSIAPDTPLELLGDALRLKQILGNLVGNAIKFSQQGEIKIDVTLDPNSTLNDDNKTSLLFTVQDQGKGISPESQDNLFKLFSQLDGSDSREQGGTGLGLAVSKGLVDLMHGAIGVDSTGENGARFWFKVKFGVNRAIHSLGNQAKEDARKPRFRANVLAVDDTPANLKLLSELLKGFGVTVFQANDGMEALGQCEQKEFDLIFMDIQMPVLNGMETTRRLRQLEQAPKRVPVVALTAHAMTDQKTDLLLAGLDDYLSKPISENQLQHILQRWLSDKLVDDAQPTISKDELRPDQQNEGNSYNINSSPSPVDIGLSLKLSNNKPDLARDMMKMLLTDLPEQRAIIVESQQNNDLIALESVVHKIRGGASYCGVPKLKKSSALADELLRKQKYQATSITALLEDIDELLSFAEEVDLEVLFELESTG